MLMSCCDRKTSHVSPYFTIVLFIILESFVIIEPFPGFLKKYITVTDEALLSNQVA